MEILKAAFVVLVIIGSATSALLKILYEIQFVNVYMTRNMCCNRPFHSFFKLLTWTGWGKCFPPG